MLEPGERFARELRNAEERLRATGLSGRGAFLALTRHLCERLGLPDSLWPEGPDAPEIAALHKIPLASDLDLFGLAYERFFTDLAQTQPFTGAIEPAAGLATGVDGPTYDLLYGDAPEGGAPLTQLGFQPGLAPRGDWRGFLVLLSLVLSSIAHSLLPPPPTTTPSFLGVLPGQSHSHIRGTTQAQPAMPCSCVSHIPLGAKINSPIPP